MKPTRSKLKVIFAILFGTLLSITPFNPVRLADDKSSLEVCAADVTYKDLGTGVACSPKKRCLGSSLYEKITSGEIRVHSSDRNPLLGEDLRKEWEGGDSIAERDICISDNVTGISASQRIENNAVFQSVWFRRGFCQMDNPSLQRVVTAGGSQTICCPVGYVGAATETAASSSMKGFNEWGGGKGNLACCPARPELGDKVYLAYDDFGAKTSPFCKYFIDDKATDLYPSQLGEKIYTDHPSTDLDELLGPMIEDELAAEKIVFNKVDDNIVQDEINEMNSFLNSCEPGTSHIIENTNTSGDVININCGDSVLFEHIPAGNAFSCPANNCVMIDNGLIRSSNDLDSTYSNRKCERCFGENEVISASDGATGGELTICKPSATGQQTITMPACNNSIIDTIACLGGANASSQNANSAGIGSSNYDLCCACREQGGVWTGIGCTDTTPTGLITGLIRIVYGVMGGVALIMLIYAGVMYQTGNEANVKKARESIIRTVTGLIVLTFSILILRVIGINVLDILPTGSI